MAKYIFLIYIGGFILLNSCTIRQYDPEMDMSKSDYDRKLSNKALGEEGIRACRVEPPIPRLSKIVAVPENPKFNEEKTISISANEDVPIVDLLLEIGRIAEVDIVVDKRIEGSIFLSMKNRPLFDVLDRIAEFADLRYSVQNGTIVVEYDDPYLHTYDVSFLNMKRQNSSSMNVSTAVLSGGNINGGSSTSLSANSQDTFWEDISKNVMQIVSGTQTISNRKRGLQDQQNQAMNSRFDQDNNMFGGINSANNNFGGGSLQNGGGGVNNNTNSLNTGGGQNGLTNSNGMNNNMTSGNGTLGNANINISKSTGMMSVVTSKKGHAKIEKYLAELKTKVTAQVLIEVKLAEVILNKNFAFGIDWNYARNLTGDTAGYIKSGTSALSSLTSNTFTMSNSFTRGGATITNAVNMLDTFGITKILASPRLMALNNQQAILTFADNQVYFEINISSTAPVVGSAGGTVVGSNVTVTSTPKTIPVGIILSLQPSIDLKNKTIMLNVRPTLSRVKETVADPGFTFAAKQAKVTDVPTNSIPVTSVREMDSILNMKSEDIMVMGGFTERSSVITENGIPGLSSIPILRYFFSKKVEEQQVKEIVFIIKATIVNEQTDIHEYDKYFYKTFFSDPREFMF